MAEMAAAFLCADLAVPGSWQHAEYIRSWVKVIRSDKKAIFTASRLAQEAADFLLGMREQKGGQIVGEAARKDCFLEDSVHQEFSGIEY